jgi:hypothetical protein
MSSIIHSLSDVVTSLVELVWSFFTTAGDLVKQTISFGFKFASELVDLVVNFFKGLVDLAGGIAGFVLGKWSRAHDIVSYWFLTIHPRQCPYARSAGCRHLRFLAVSAQPGQDGAGWQQEAELAAGCFSMAAAAMPLIPSVRYNLYDTRYPLERWRVRPVGLK